MSEFKWSKPENSEISPNSIYDKDGNKIFYYNQYSDSILRERKLGHLLCLSSEGEELWEFVFPDYSYLYFDGELILKSDEIYVLVNSNREYDSGFERGVYVFDMNGSYKCNQSIRHINNSLDLNSSKGSNISDKIDD